MKIALRTDGTAVVMDAPLGPYHVASKQDDPYGKYDLDEIIIYAQEHPEDVVEELEPETPEVKEIDIHLNYLNSTDWYVTRFAETGKPIPADVLLKRTEARDRISEIRLLNE